MSKLVYSHQRNEVFTSLRRDAHELVNMLEPDRRAEILLKAFVFPVLYFLIYSAALYGGGKDIVFFFACYFFQGVALVFVFLNTIHDAVHSNIFKSKRANQLYVYIFDLLGANSFIWQVRHIRFHHNYPNVAGWDSDFEQSKLARVFPSGSYSGFHKYQHIYLPLLYPFYLPNWILVRDFADFFDKTRTVHKQVKIPRIEFVKLFLFKGLFLLHTVILPKFLLDISWLQVIVAFGIMLFTASILSLFVLLSPHANSESEFPLPDGENRLPYNWMMHMMATSNDVTLNNWFTRYFMGCFNFHVVHHLFPNINHAYYPELTSLLKDYAQKYDLPYREYSLTRSLKNHYLLLKQNGITENIFEESM